MICSARTSPLPLVDRWGNPLSGERVRPLANELAKPVRRSIHAGYDAAKKGTAFDSHWQGADAFDADSCNSAEVRHTLARRAREEVRNNGYMDRIVQTHANYLIGKTGPTLRMQTNSTGFNQTIETLFWNWMQAVRFRRKLLTMALSKTVDGEGLALTGTNPKVANRVKLDLRPIEMEQCQTPLLPWGTKNQIDGITLDDWGNPDTYQVLREHPGATNNELNLTPDSIPARFVLHWFFCRRPGQHRGISELASTLNVGAHSRRMREAIVKTVERAASFSLLMKTQQLPSDDPPEGVDPWSAMPIQDDMAAFLPEGWDPFQMEAKHPNAQYKDFCQQQLAETASAKCMPYNVAAGDSRESSFSSGKLDHIGYWAALDLERQECNESVLDPLFALWWAEAVQVYGFASDPNTPPVHGWNWPAQPIIDIAADANARDTNLKNGSLGLEKVYADLGLDYEDEKQKQAESAGITPEQVAQIHLLTLFPAAAQVLGLQPAAAEQQQAQQSQQMAAMQRRLVDLESRIGELLGAA